MIKPIGSENQLQKLSQNKLAGIGTSSGPNAHKPLASPVVRKSQVKTETNWTNQTANKFAPYERQINASYSIFNSKVGSQDAGIRRNRERNENINLTNVPHE